MNEIEKYIQEHEIAIISVGSSGGMEPKIHTDSHILTTRIRAVLLSYRYGIKRVSGRGNEEISHDQVIDDEDCFIVVNLPRKDGTVDEDFKERIFNLSERMGRDTFSYSPKDSTKGYAIGTSKASWPDYGKSVELNDFIRDITTLVKSDRNDGCSLTPLGSLDTLYNYNNLSRRLIMEDAHLFFHPQMADMEWYLSNGYSKAEDMFRRIESMSDNTHKREKEEN